MMKPRRHLISYVASLPWDLVAWGVVLAIRALWGKELCWERPRDNPETPGAPGGPVLTCELRGDSLPARKGRWLAGWYLRPDGFPWGGTTLGHAIFYGPGRRSRPGERWSAMQVHEHVHVEQFESAMLSSMVVGAVVAVGWHPIAGVAVWFTGVLQFLCASWVTAILRGEPAYRGSHHETAAYAVEKSYRAEVGRG